MAWDSVHPFECPTRVFFGWDASAQVGDRLRELGVTRALLVSDPGVAGAGIVDRISARISAAGIEVVTYTGVQPNPTVANVDLSPLVLIIALPALAVGAGIPGVILAQAVAGGAAQVRARAL